MKYNINSFFNEEDATVNDKKYAHYYLDLISTILPYFKNDNIVDNYKELVEKLTVDFGLTDTTNYERLDSRESGVSLEFKNSLFSLELRTERNLSFIDLYRTGELNIYCTLIRDDYKYTPVPSAHIINNRFLHYNKLLDIPSGYTSMVFEHTVDD